MSESDQKEAEEVPASFLDHLRDKRHESSAAPASDMHHVASIPVAIVEKWMAEGFNIFDKNVSMKEVIRRLNGDANTRADDHETRIRHLEGGSARLLGIGSVLAMVVGVAGSRLVELTFGH